MFNVGSLTMITPTRQFLDTIFQDGGIKQQPLNDLISFSVDSDRVFQIRKNVQMTDDADIQIKGTINAQKGGIDIIAGRNVGIENGAKLNANTNLSPADMLVNTPSESFTTAISNGKNIIIVSKNNSDSTNGKNQVVNIDGIVNTNVAAGNAADFKGKNAGNVFIAAQSDKANNSASVNINEHAQISGNDVDIKAINKVSKFEQNNMGISDELKSDLFITDDIIEYFVPNMSDVESYVTVNSGANITALNDLNLSTLSSADLSSTFMLAALCVNYTELNVNSNVLVKSGANLSASNLNAEAKTDVKLDVSSKSSGLLDSKLHNSVGDLAVLVLNENIDTSSIIEKNVTLDIVKDIVVNADTKNYVSATTKNGIVPVLDKNEHDGFFGAFAVTVIDAKTKAAFDSNADIEGKLDVTANATGRIESKVNSTAGGSGESGKVATWGKTLVKNFLFTDGSKGKWSLTHKLYNKLDDVKTRGDAQFTNFDIAAGINVNVTDYTTDATIGSESNKPVISAGRVDVSAKTVDDASNIATAAIASNAATAAAGAVSVHIKDLNTNALANGDFTLTNTDSSNNALNISAQTKINHPLSYYTWVQDFWESLNLKEIFSLETMEELFKALADGVTPDGLRAPDMTQVSDKFNMPDLDFLLKGPANLENFGLEGLYNTYAQAAANARTREGSTKGLSGAIAVNVMDTLANAGLMDGAKVTLNGASRDLNKVSITSDVSNESWVMAALFNPLEFSNLMMPGARDGSAAGGGISLNYSNNDSKAFVGKNAIISQTSGKAGDVTVKSTFDGNFVTISEGASNADNSGSSGAIGLTLHGGETSAKIADGAQIDANNLVVEASKDAEYINTVLAFSLSEKSIAFGISGIGLWDNIAAYTGGTVTADGKADILADSDTVIVNVNNNIGLAKEGTDPPAGQREPEDALSRLNEMGKGSGPHAGLNASDIANAATGAIEGSEKAQSAWQQAKAMIKEVQDVDDAFNDWERKANPDKETSAYAGSVNANVSVSNVTAQIGENAVVKAGSDLNVKANVDNITVNEAGAVSANGKTGGGGAIVTDVIVNDAIASIGSNASVDAKRNMLLDANQDYVVVQAGVGAAVAKSTSGAGTVGVLVQTNNTKSLIGEGAKINQTYKDDKADENQTVSLNAKNKNVIVKGLGALGIQAGGQGASGKAVGGTVDTNVIVNNATAEIQGTAANKAVVNATKDVNLTAENKNKIINADVAGAAAMQGTAASGLVSSNIVINETSSGIKNANITAGENVNLTADADFSEVAVAGAVSIGNQNAYGATLRVDVISDNVNSIIEGSTVTADNLSSQNINDMHAVSVLASGAASNNGNAAVGAVGIIVDHSTQNNYASGSNFTLTSGLLDYNTTHKNNLTAVTGNVALGNAGSSLGGSLFAFAADNNINTYLKNTEVSAKAASVNSSAVDDIYAITAGGSLSAGSSAYQGAISLLVNTGTVQSYVDGGSVTTTGSANEKSPGIKISADKNIKNRQYNGQVSGSLSENAVGGAVTTTINTNTVKAYANNTKLSAEKGTEVAAKSIKFVESTPVGVSAGTGVAVQGSVDTTVLTDDVFAYISGSEISSDVNIYANNDTTVKTILGGAAVSGKGAVGAAVYTNVITGDTKAYISDSQIKKDINNLIVKADTHESLNVLAASGSVSTGSVAVAGVVNTPVITRDTIAYIDNVDSITNNANISNIDVQAVSNSEISPLSGGISASAGAGVGATAYTLVLNKDVKANIKNSKLKAKTVSVKAENTDDDYSITLAGGFAGQAGVGGAVSTTVFSNDVEAGISQTKITEASKIDVNATNTTNLEAITGGAGGGTVGVGASVNTNVLNNTVKAFFDGGSADVRDAVTVKAQTFDNFINTVTVSGAAGEVGVSGSVNTNVISNSTDAYFNSVLTGTSNLTVAAADIVDFRTIADGAAGAGMAGVGMTVLVNSISNKVAAYLGGDITAANINLNAKTQQTFFDIYAMGFGVGAVGGAGTVMVNTIDNTTQAFTLNGKDNDNKLVISADSLSVNAKSITHNDAFTASGGIGAVGVGATVFVNNITNKTKAFTGKHNDITTTGATSIEAYSENKFGDSSKRSGAVAGAVGAGFAIAGTVLTNYVEDKVIAGIGDNNVLSSGSLSVEAKDDTSIYSVVGSGSLGYAAVGAGVNVNTVNNTVNAYIGNNGIITTTGSDVVVNAENQVTLDNLGYIIGGGMYALSGGVVISNIGKNVASYSDSDVKKNEDSANAQKREAVDFANSKIAEAISAAAENTEEGIKSGTVEVTNSIERNNATSAFVGNNTVVNSAGALEVTALDDTNSNLETFNLNVGSLSIGVSGAVSNTNSTVEAFVGQGSNLSAAGALTLKAESKDNATVDTMAAGGGIVGVSSNFSLINSNKLTNVYTLSGSTMKSSGADLLISAISSAIANSYADSWQFGGITVGAAIAHASANGSTTVNLGSDNAMAGKNITVKADSATKADSNAKAVVGALVGGSGAESESAAGQTTSVNAGANLNVEAQNVLKIHATADHEATSEANGRSYGVISAGGAVADSEINATNTIKIADATKTSKINAESIEIGSGLTNNAESKTLAGAGAIAAVSGSGSNTKITAKNEALIGKNYNISTTNGDLAIAAATTNSFRSSNDSSAYGIIAAGAGTINNSVNSTVNVKSDAKSLKAKQGKLFINAQNETTKADYGYDLKGGAGGLVGVGAADLKTSVIHNTTATLNGDEAAADKDIAVAAQNKVDVTEKVDIYAAGAIPVTTGHAKINNNGETINSTVNIGNKHVKATQDTTYKAYSNISLYGKTNVTARGVAPIADGDSYVKANSTNKLNINSGSFTDGQRDVYLEASANSSVNSYIDTDSKGLIWDLGDANTKAYNTVYDEINIASNARVSAFDKMSLIAKASNSAVGSKSAKTVFYLLFGIPITIRNSDNSDGSDKTKISSTNNVVINGDVSSGAGAVRELHLKYDENGQVVYDGNIEYGQYEQDSGLTADAIDETIKQSEGRYNSEKANLEASLAEKDKTITEKNTQITTAQNNINKNNSQISTLNGNIADADLAYNKISTTAYNLAESELTQAKAAINNSSLTQAQKSAYITKLSSGSALTSEELSTVRTAITNYKSGLSATVAELTNQNTNYTTAIENQRKDIEKLGSQKDVISDAISQLEASYKEEKASLEAQKNAAGNQTLQIAFVDVKNTKVRSGETEIKGNLSGSGTISAPGDKFVIDIQNDTLSNIRVNDLEIEKDVKGKIYINGSDVLGNNLNGTRNGVNLNLRNESTGPAITISNNIDANDPSFNLDQQNKAGDMYLNGTIQNVSGTAYFKNLSGSIVSEGSTIAKSISMFVPNGDMYQGFSDQFMDVAGADGTGSGIYAGVDITIMARSINVNGLIKSGTADKNVVINEFKTRKTADGYEQLVGDKWVAMEKSPNPQKNWYLITGDALSGIDMTNPDNPETIKAYWDPDNNQIQLFNAEITGGDVTLIGNVVSTGNGRIEVVSGYGHIDVVNNTGIDLVTNALNADNKIDGKVTIRDFYDEATIKNSEYFKQLEAKYQDKSDVEHTAFWEDIYKNTYEYTAQRDDNGKINVSQNHSHANDSNYSQITVNGNEAVFTPEQNGGSQILDSTTKTEVRYEYIKKSWFYELFFGKQYQKITVVTDEEQWSDAKNPIKISFSGYDEAQVNVTSNNSNIYLNKNISSLPGTVNIASGGVIQDITADKGVHIMGKDVNLSAKDDIGAYDSLLLDKSIKIDLMGGKLTAASQNGDAYISVTSGNLNNFNIQALNGLAYVNAVNGNIVADSAAVMKAKNISLKAGNGDISIKTADNLKAEESFNAQASGNVDIDYDGDLTIGMIKSGEDTSISTTGSIKKGATATEDTANIEAANIKLTSKGGSIGALADGGEITVKSSGTVTADAKKDISLYAQSNMFVNKITAGNNVRLVAEKGIINANAGADTEAAPYNVKANNLTLMAINNNIENMNIDIDGSLEAYAGYRVVNGESALLNPDSIIQVNQLSRVFSQQEADSITMDDVAKLKDLKIDNILAPNAFLTSEKSLLAGANIIKTTDSIVFTAINGSVGSADNFINVAQDGAVSAYAKDSVYISSDKDLKVKEIMGYNDKQRTNSANETISINEPLKKVVLKSGGNIIDGNDEYFSVTSDGETILTENEKPNIIAQSIELYSNGTIGSGYDAFDVYTVDGGAGLSVNAPGEVHIASVYDIKLGNIEAGANVDIIAKELAYTSKDQYSEVYKNISADRILTDANLNISAKNVNIEDSDVKGTVKIAAQEEVNLVSSADLKLDSIKSIDENGVLEKVSVKTTSGDILDANQRYEKQDFGGETVEDTKNEEAVIAAKTIVLDSASNIGTATDAFDVETAAGGDGLSVKTGENAFISSSKDLALNDVSVGKNADIKALEYVHTSAEEYSENYKNITANKLSSGETMNLTASNVEVKDAGKIGLLNINADKNVNFNSSENINIGSINSISGGFTENVEISSKKDILNGNTDNTANINAENVKLTAENAGSESTALVINQPAENRLELNANNLASIHLVGENANISEIKSNNLKLKAENDININNLTANTANISTKTTNLSVNNANIRDYAEYHTINKFVVNENRTTAPRFDANAQIQSNGASYSLVIDSSNNIKTNKEFVTRQNTDIRINDDYEHQSMDASARALSVNTVQNNTTPGVAQSGANPEMSVVNFNANKYNQNKNGDIIKERKKRTVILDDDAESGLTDTVKKETNGEYSNVIPVNFKTMTEMPVDSTSVSNFIRSLKKLPEKDRKKIIEKFVDEYVQTSLGYAQ